MGNSRDRRRPLSAPALAGEAGRFIWANRRVLGPLVLGVLAINWLGDVTTARMMASAGEKADTGLSWLAAAQAFIAAGSGVVQPWPRIIPLWGLFPQMTDPLALVAFGNVFELAAAVLSAVFAVAFLNRAVRSLRSERWIKRAPGIFPAVAGIFLWFRSYGPLSDLIGVITGRLPAPVWGTVWQIITLVVFLPLMFSVYLMLLEKAGFSRAAGMSLALWRQARGAIAPIMLISLAIFLVPALSGRLFAGPGRLELAIAMVATLIKVVAGFWLATVWLYFVEGRARLPR